MIKKYIAIIIGLGLFISNVVAQTIVNQDLVNGACFTANVCAEVVDSQPTVVTEYFVREGHSRIIANEKFICVGDEPCVSAPTEAFEYDRNKWILPVYDGGDNQEVVVNKTTRVVGVPSNYTQASTKIYQVVHGDTLVFVFNKNGGLVSWSRNPKPNVKYSKNSTVIICHAE